MSEINLKLDAEALKGLASESILSQLSQDERNSILTQAVSYLLTPKESSYGYGKKTPLQEAFKFAIETIAKDIAQNVLDEMPEVRLKMKELVAEAYHKALVELRDETIKELSESIVSAMCCHR